jgi:uncharacterized low-complexity protein
MPDSGPAAGTDPAIEAFIQLDSGDMRPMADKKLIVSTVGTLAALSFSTSAFADDPNSSELFEAENLNSGFMGASVGFGEGSCGEGSCGEEKEEEGSCGEGACGEGSCGEDGDKGEEGSCGEGACGEGTCGA